MSTASTGARPTGAAGGSGSTSPAVPRGSGPGLRGRLGSSVRRGRRVLRNRSRRHVLRVGRWVVRRLYPPPAPRGPAGYLPGEAVPAEVVVYFPDTAPRLYQLAQWLPVLERLDSRHRVLVVTRRLPAYNAVLQLTSLRTIYVPTFRELTSLYSRHSYKVALYVNNSVGNFQSLSSPRMLHVHVNHGESDKISMVSNQAKAYDRVFVAGEAAVLRHRAALLELDESRLVRVGRPQLDLTPPPVLAPTTRRTVLYAPTWEGENEANNYTSVDRYGPAIVCAALEQPDARVVYKPHPRVATSRNPAVAQGHASIVRLLQDAAFADPAAGHTVLTEGDILAVLPEADLMITDVSSVALDFLYLRTDRPLVITDRRSDRDRLAADAPVSVGADVIDADSISTVGVLLAERLVGDARRAERERLRRFYFGGIGPGESTTRFLEEVTSLVQLRDRLVAAKYAGSDGSEGSDGAGSTMDGQAARRWETTGRTLA